MKTKFLLPLLLAFLCTATLWSQNKEIFTLKLDHLALSVKDLDRSVDFYKNVLNLSEITNLTKKEGIRWISLGDGKELHLVSTIKEPVTINKAVHLAFKVINFEALIDKLQNLNIPYSDWPGALDKITIRADGIKQIYIQDPDGYWIEINSLEK
jgi:lactoylglutathione lyase